MIEISENLAESAGKLRGRYPFLKTFDAIQISAALDVGADAFLTNDKKLKQIKENKGSGLSQLFVNVSSFYMASPSHSTNPSIALGLFPSMPPIAHTGMIRFMV